MQATADEGEGNEAGVRRIEAALDGWLGAGPGGAPAWEDIDALNMNATVRFSPALLDSGASVVPVELVQQLFMADAMVPAMTLQAAFATHLFEGEVRPLVLDRVAPLEGRDRTPVELYRREFAALFEHMRQYSEHMRTIREELVRLGF